MADNIPPKSRPTVLQTAMTATTNHNPTEQKPLAAQVPTKEEFLRQSLASTLHAVYVALKPFDVVDKKHLKTIPTMTTNALLRDSCDTSTAVCWLTQRGTVPESFTDSPTFKQFAAAHAATKTFDDEKWAQLAQHKQAARPDSFHMEVALDTPHFH